MSSSSALKMSSTSPDEESRQVLNVLFLHGKGSNAQMFRNQMSPLEEKLQSQEAVMNLKFHFDYLDAPFLMSNHTIGNQREWWTLPPGVRSFHAKEYKGFDMSKALVWNAVQNKKYDFIVGHSQGAILLSALITSQDWNADVKGYIFNGAAWPNPFEDQMNKFCQEKESMSSSLNQSKILFIMGDTDTINPTESAIKVRNVLEHNGSGFNYTVDTIHHSGGHAVPVKDEMALQSITDWIFGAVIKT
jgi:predicted esterase